jgi:hypothetical protein
MNDIFKKRTPLSVVVGDDKLMGKLWKQLSVPQQTIIKALYGLPLNSVDEQKAWAVLNDNCKIDSLGFVEEWWAYPYEPKEYQELVALIGRRSGKSYITCFIALYEIIFGGHAAHVKDGQEFVIPYIAQDLSTARVNMRTIALLAKEVPFLAATLVDEKPNFLKFANNLTVQIEPPRIKTGRGWAMPIIIMDEVGFWATSDEAADPDYEVQRAVSPSTFQFPHRKMLIISSPYTEVGLLWEYYKAGTDGRKLAKDDLSKPQYKDSLVLRSSTAAMENPTMKGFMRSQMEKEQARDPEGFVREYLARFVKTVSSFILGSDVDKCTQKEHKELSPQEVLSEGWIPSFVATMDPAFKQDEFAFTIMHNDHKGQIVQDVLKTWTPNKKLGLEINPETVMAEIARECKRWDISIIYSDQYQLEALQQIALRHGLVVIKYDFTARSKARMYGSLNTLLRTGTIKLLNHHKIYQQLTRLTMKRSAQNTIQISAPEGEHDDVATVVAMAADLAIQFRPSQQKELKKEPTLWEQGLAQIEAKKIGARSDFEDHYVAWV